MKNQFSQIVMSVAAIVGLSVSLQANAEIIQAAQKAPTQNERDAKVASDKQTQAMTAAALQVLNLIDQGKSSEIWEGLSPAIKPLVSRDSFTQHIRSNQSNFGAASKRASLSAYRSDADGQSNAPKGTYYSVVFLTNFAKGQGRELVSFRLDNDQTWRVAGYSLTAASK